MRKAHFYPRFVSLLATLLLAINSLPSVAQYYYNDLVSVQQINETYRLFKSNKVSKVNLSSFQGNEPVTEGFVGEQKVSTARNEVMTYTKTLDLGESFFTAFYTPQGLLKKTIDSAQQSVSSSVYEYDADNRLVTILNNVHASDKSSYLSEIHKWTYTPAGKPLKMLRIKNNKDSTFVSFLLDEKGNVSEEDVVGKTVPNQKIYYYYDDQHRLTDVVKYNQKAKRLLPDYIFEYEDDELSTMTIVPEGSSEYQKYYYKYDENGLKLIEFCYNKRNQLLGKVQYSYTFGR